MLLSRPRRPPAGLRAAGVLLVSVAVAAAFWAAASPPATSTVAPGAVGLP